MSKNTTKTNIYRCLGQDFFLDRDYPPPRVEKIFGVPPLTYKSEILAQDTYPPSNAEYLAHV